MAEDFADDITAEDPDEREPDRSLRDLCFGSDAPPPDQGDSVFPALAEVHRREGRPDEAEQVARRGLAFEPGRSDGRLVLALALLDQGGPDQVAEAREVLATLAERVLEVQGITASSLESARSTRASLAGPAAEGAAPPAGSFDDDVSEQEIEHAFAAAETDRDQVIDADHIAQQAMRLVDGDLDDDLLSAPEAPFATRTMADLLERQGDPQRASRIRAALSPAARASAEAPASRDESGHGRRQRIISELEGWLENLRRPRA